MRQFAKRTLTILLCAAFIIGSLYQLQPNIVYAATKHTITYKLYGGKNNTSNPAYYTNKNITLKKPVKKGYSFVGWYLEPTYLNKATTINASKKKNVTLYAKWKINAIPAKDMKIPTLRLDGNWPCSDSKLQNAWKTYYPYFALVMGEAAYKDRVLTWNWDPAIYNDTVEYTAETNTVFMGPVEHIADGIAKKNYMNLYFQMMHESGHLFYQYDKNIISINVGQWLFEALPLSSEAITKTLLGIEEWDQNYISYDSAAYMGDNCINGVYQDSSKYDRTLTDSSASGAVQMMINCLSCNSGLDYLKRVNKLMFDYIAKEDSSGQITKAQYGKFLDQAANGKTIDGKKPSEWLFTQPVSNTKGDIGDFIGCFPVESVLPESREVRIRFYAFSRYTDETGDLQETAMSRQKITFEIYNQSGACKQIKTAYTQGGESEATMNELPAGLYKIKMSTVKDGKTITGYNYFLVSASKNVSRNLTNDDNRMYILPIDKETQNIVPYKKGQYNVKGTISCQLINGALLITASPGAQVTITANGKTSVITKPLGARVVPLDVR